MNAGTNCETHFLRSPSNFGTLDSESRFTKSKSGKFARLNATSDQYLPRLADGRHAKSGSQARISYALR